MGKLRDRMLVDLQLSGAKPSTQRTYLREAENLAKYFHKSPEQLREDELKAYLLHLMKERHLSEGTFRFYVAGLKFLYRTTLKREWAVEKIRYPRPKRKPPVVLDLSEIQSLFAVTKNLRKIRVYFLSIPSRSLGRRSKTHPLIISLLSLNDLGKDADANKIDLTLLFKIKDLIII